MNLGEPREIQRREAAYRAWFVKYVRAAGAFAQSIESNSTGAGIPDLYGVTLGEKRSYWMEFKVMDCLDDAIPFEPGQLNWLYEHLQLGGASLMNILVDDTLYIFSCNCVDRMTQRLKEGPSMRGCVLRVLKKDARDNMDLVLAQLDRLIRNSMHIVTVP